MSVFISVFMSVCLVNLVNHDVCMYVCILFMSVCSCLYIHVTVSGQSSESCMMSVFVQDSLYFHVYIFMTVCLVNLVYHDVCMCA